MILPVGFKARVRRNPLNTAAVRALLFGMNEPGFLFDFSDVNCMFQDTAGTLPVTAVGQSVALVLDKSRGAGYTGYTLGPELIPNGDFSAGSSGWTVGTDWTISGGRASRGPNATASNLSAGTGVIAGRTYNITWTQGPEGLAVYLGNASGPLVANVVGAGTHTRTVVATVSGGILFRANVSVSYLDNISVREVILGQFTGLGPELVTNGGFDSDTAWTKTSATISEGQANLQVNGSVFQAVIPLETGRFFQITFTVVSTAGAVIVFCGTNSSGDSRYAAQFTSAGTRTILLQSAGLTNTIRIGSNSAGASVVDNISVRELPGNHATQATLAARPLYAVHPVTGIRNELTFTEQFDNAAWTKAPQGNGISPIVTGNAGLAPNGTMTAARVQFSRASTGVGNRSQLRQTITTRQENSTGSVWLKSFDGSTQYISIVNSAANNGNIQVVVTGDWQRFDTTFSGVLSGTQNLWIGLHDNLNTVLSADVLVWGAQLELGSTSTTYQRVATRADITESVVRGLPHLLFDGIDDFLVTPTITPNTDKAQVIAGVRKLSDATVGTIIEHSATTVSNAGSFGLFSPRVVATGNYGSHLRGQARLEYITAASFSAPKSDVITALYNISESAADAENRVRVNGAAQTLSVVDLQVGPAGTGNFGAYQTFIGRRGGTSLPFNGRVYAMTTRFGATPIDMIINRVENWANTLTLAY